MFHNFYGLYRNHEIFVAIVEHLTLQKLEIIMNHKNKIVNSAEIWRYAAKTFLLFEQFKVYFNQPTQAIVDCDVLQTVLMCSVLNSS